MEDTIVKIKGKEIDIAPALPLVIRDWKILGKKGVNLKRFADADMETMAAVVHYVLNKVDKTITQDDVDSLSIKSPAFIKVMEAVGEEEEVDAPLSKPSTTLLKPTDGANPK